MCVERGSTNTSYYTQRTNEAQRVILRHVEAHFSRRCAHRKAARGDVFNSLHRTILDAPLINALHFEGRRVFIKKGRF